MLAIWSLWIKGKFIVQTGKARLFIDIPRRSGDPRDGHNRAYYDSFNPGSIKPTEQMLHKNKDGTYSIVIRLDYNQGVVLWGKMIEGEDFIFVDKVVKSYYVPSGQNP